MPIAYDTQRLVALAAPFRSDDTQPRPKPVVVPTAMRAETRRSSKITTTNEIDDDVASPSMDDTA